MSLSNEIAQQSKGKYEQKNLFCADIRSGSVPADFGLFPHRAVGISGTGWER
jgi:hypothetical protein